MTYRRSLVPVTACHHRSTVGRGAMSHVSVEGSKAWTTGRAHCAERMPDGCVYATPASHTRPAGPAAAVVNSANSGVALLGVVRPVAGSIAHAREPVAPYSRPSAPMATGTASAA